MGWEGCIFGGAKISTCALVRSPCSTCDPCLLETGGGGGGGISTLYVSPNNSLAHEWSTTLNSTNGCTMTLECFPTSDCCPDAFLPLGPPEPGEPALALAPAPELVPGGADIARKRQVLGKFSRLIATGKKGCSCSVVECARNFTGAAPCHGF